MNCFSKCDVCSWPHQLVCCTFYFWVQPGERSCCVDLGRAQWSHTVRSFPALHDWPHTFLPLLFKNHSDACVCARVCDSRDTWPGTAPSTHTGHIPADKANNHKLQMCVSLNLSGLSSCFHSEAFDGRSTPLLNTSITTEQIREDVDS